MRKRRTFRELVALMTPTPQEALVIAPMEEEDRKAYRSGELRYSWEEEEESD